MRRQDSERSSDRSLEPEAEQGSGVELTISKDGDEIERNNWEGLKQYAHRYEDVWRILVAPLRAPDSIWFRDGIDKDFEEFAMCHYTTYVNLARALDKLLSRRDDLKFADEIWSNMQHSAEVATKAIDAYKKIHLACSMPRRNPRINTTRLEDIKGVLKKYRNSLHDPIIGTAKRNGVRLWPKQERLDQYHYWTSVMYHRREDDFVPVEDLLRSHFQSLTSALQGVWGEILMGCDQLKHATEFRNRRAAGVTSSMGSTSNPIGVSGTIVVPHH
jgi:hypothetical protein